MNAANQRIKYTPVIGGATHLTWLPRRPADGVVVPLLCGSAYEVASGISTPPADHGCETAWPRGNSASTRNIPFGV
jgi:hypothetical protein